MEKHEARGLPADSTLPRPIVLSLDDMATVAAAGASLALSSLASKIIICGGIPPAPYMSVAAMY